MDGEDTVRTSRRHVHRGLGEKGLLCGHVWERRGYDVAMFGREGVMMWPCLGEKGL